MSTEEETIELTEDNFIDVLISLGEALHPDNEPEADSKRHKKGE